MAIRRRWNIFNAKKTIFPIFLMILCMLEKYETAFVEFPYEKSLVIGKNYCQLTAVNIAQKNETISLPPFSEEPICYFDAAYPGQWFINSSPKLIEYIYFSGNDSLKVGHKLEIPANIKSDSFDYNYFFKFEFDFKSRNIYGISTKSGIESDKLFIVDVLSGYYNILLSNLESPNHISLDSKRGLIFVSQATSILKVSMDGTSAKKIVHQDGISNVVADYARERIYWISFNAIESSNYEGKDQVTIIKDSNPILSLAVLNNQLFWASSPHRLNLTSTIWACDYTTDQSCVKKEFASTDVRSNDEKISLRTFDMTDKDAFFLTKNSNSYHPDNCDQIALLSNKTDGYSCACRLGYRLKSDDRSCEPVYDFLLYIEDNFIKGKRMGSVENEAFADVIEPNILESKADVKYFDYDYTKNTIYFIDELVNYTLFSKELLLNRSQFELDTYKNITDDDEKDYEKVTSLCYDWMSQNIYILYDLYKDVNFLQNEYHGGIRVYHSASKNRLQNFKTKLVEFSHNGVRESNAIVVHPKLGKVYFSIDNLGIYTVNADGTNLELYVEANHPQVQQTLTIDYTEDILYWMTGYRYDTKTLQKRSLTSNPNWKETVFEIPVYDPTSITFYQTVAFVTNATSIWRMDKTSGEFTSMVVGLPDFPKVISGVKIHSREAQPLYENHPCAINRGHCQKFCFAILANDEKNLKRKCGCEDKETLHANGRTCIKNYSTVSKVTPYAVSRLTVYPQFI